MISERGGRRRTYMVAFGTVLMCASTALAQTGASLTARTDAMHQLDQLIGQWKGSGWSIGQTGTRTTFTSVESVQSRVAGTVLLIEGRSISKGDNGQETATHDGLVAISYDDKTRHYCWNGHDAAMGATNADLTVVPGKVSWTITPDTRGTVVRFTIMFDAKAWNETGQVSTDGTTRNTFMEMHLTRQ